MMSDKPTINITSHNQSGGITAHTVNVAPTRAAFEDSLKQQILKEFPKRRVVLQTVGNQPDQLVGDEVHEFLVANGFPVERRSIGMMAPSPHEPFSAEILDEAIIFTVAPSAR